MEGNGDLPLWWHREERQDRFTTCETHLWRIGFGFGFGAVAVAVWCSVRVDVRAGPARLLSRLQERRDVRG